MSRTAIINVTIIRPDRMIPNGAVIFEDGVITAFGEKKKLSIPSDCVVIDGEGYYCGPGLVDIHTHAGNNIFFTDDPIEAAQEHLHHGTTSVYPALYFSFDSEGYVKAIDRIREAMKDNRCRNISGVYMEGPYLNPKFGCDKDNNPWPTVDRNKYMPVIEAAKDLACVWAVAPEREGILDYINDVRKLVPDAVFSVAHSEAAPWEVEALIPYGLKIGTHHTDATGKYHEYPDPEILGVGVDEAVNMNDDIYAELIVDSLGVHVHPYMIRLIRKIKGDSRIILISDAYAAHGPIPEGYDGVDDLNFDITGEIAGSRLTLDKACRNMMRHTGASLVNVFNYASYNPAAAIGLKDRGEIAVGKRADIILTDDEMNVKKVIHKGELL
ncbi:MAG: amidohydrolase family protein [Lachnospiraceae bacterium]|nr:amidohydrolase family protein [Candidatus Darwinimomas equi]